MQIVIKLVDICYLSILYLFMGLIFSDYINELLSLFQSGNPEDWPTYKIILSVSAQISLISLSAYLIRNIVECIPNPFETFNYKRSKQMPELNGGIVIAFTLMLLQSSLRDKLLIIHKRFKIL